MKFVPNAVTAKVGRQILVGQKHSPTILFVGGVVGVVATTVLACRATLKVEEILEEAQGNLKDAKKVHALERDDYTDRDYQKDVAYIYIKSAVAFTKLYGPAIVVGVASVSALTGAHKILSNRNAALTAAYAAIEKGFSDYRKRVVDELGEDKDREFRYSSETSEVVDETDKGPKVSKVNRVGANGASVYARFFDEYSKSWQKTPEYNLVFLRCQQNYANDMLHARGHVFLNEVYDMLGIERSKAGQVVGWVVGEKGDNEIDFGIFDGDNPKARDFVNGREGSILLDFNVDGVIYDKI